MLVPRYLATEYSELLCLPCESHRQRRAMHLPGAGYVPDTCTDAGFLDMGVAGKHVKVHKLK